MPYTTNVAGTTITAAWGNANIRDQVVTPFASAAARTSAITSPVQGMVSYRTDSNILENYDNTSWAPVQANFMARTTRTADTSTFTTTETLCDSVSFTAVAGRRYRVMWSGSVQSTVSGDNIETRLRYAAGGSVANTDTLISGKLSGAPGASISVPVTMACTVTGIAAGNTTVGFFGIRTFGTGNIKANAAANYPTELWVEDIGR